MRYDGFAILLTRFHREKRSFFSKRGYFYSQPGNQICQSDNCISLVGLGIGNSSRYCRAQWKFVDSIDSVDSMNGQLYSQRNVQSCLWDNCIYLTVSLYIDGKYSFQDKRTPSCLCNQRNRCLFLFSNFHPCDSSRKISCWQHKSTGIHVGSLIYCCSCMENPTPCQHAGYKQ